MKPTVVIGCVLTLALTGCFYNTKPAGPNPNAPKVTRAPVETNTGRAAAVLSIHLRKEMPDACMFGMTLTNNLGTKITDISVRLSAYIQGGIVYDQITRNFYELRPTEGQYREVTFTGIKCSQIDYIGVSDPGRCAIGEENRFTTSEGDCAKFIDVAENRLVAIRKVALPKKPPPPEA